MLDIVAESTQDEAVAVVTRALARGVTTTGRLRAELAARFHMRHRALLVKLLDKANTGIESALEWRFQEKVLIPHGLPIPDRQVKREAGRVDGMYSAYGLIVELDGLRDHNDATRDMTRDNRNMLQDDARTLRYGWDGVGSDACLAARVWVRRGARRIMAVSARRR